MKKKKQRSFPGEELEYFKQKSKAMQVEQNAKPKSRKAKKIIERKEYILQHDPKHTVFMKGSHCSQIWSNAMKELHKMRDPDISKTLLSVCHDVLPFEDASYIEKTAYKHDAGIVVCGTHNKKRPNNMIICRLYDMKILDMLEFGVEEWKTMQEFGRSHSIEVGQQPILIFQGDAFDLSEKHLKFKNMMIDFFRIKHLESVNILALQRIVTFTATSTDGNITIQQFETEKINEGLAGENKIETKEVGPKISLSLRRIKDADRDTWKAATKVIKSKSKQLDKKHNISYNELGQKIGKAYIQQQDLVTLGLRKLKRKKVAEGEQNEVNDGEVQIENQDDLSEE